MITLHNWDREVKRYCQLQLDKHQVSTESSVLRYNPHRIDLTLLKSQGCIAIDVRQPMMKNTHTEILVDLPLTTITDAAIEHLVNLLLLKMVEEGLGITYE